MRYLVDVLGLEQAITAKDSSSETVHARNGLRALGQRPLLTALAAGQFLAAPPAEATSALLVVLAQDRLGGGGSLGVPVAAIGAGATLGHCCCSAESRTPAGR